MLHRSAPSVIVVILVVCQLVAAPQEVSRVLRDGNRATLTVFGGRPLDSAAELLAKEFGLQVNVEDPSSFSQHDVEDVTAQVSRVQRPLRKTFVPTGRLLEVAFALTADGMPADATTFIHSLVDGANAQTPFAYRIDSDGEEFSLVATRTRDEQAHVVDLIPLLDRRITIPAGTRRIFEHANLLAHALEEQTGVRISCCQAFVAGIPWGSRVISFEARDEQARTVFRKLIRATPGRFHWLMRCEPGASWCFINLARIG